MLDNATIRRTYGERIRGARLALSLTQRQLADAVAASGLPCWPQTISHWENGETLASPAAQIAVANVLGVTHSDLFGLDGELA